MLHGSPKGLLSLVKSNMRYVLIKGKVCSSAPFSFQNIAKQLGMTDELYLRAMNLQELIKAQEQPSSVTLPQKHIPLLAASLRNTTVICPHTGKINLEQTIANMQAHTSGQVRGFSTTQANTITSPRQLSPLVTELLWHLLGTTSLPNENIVIIAEHAAPEELKHEGHASNISAFLGETPSIDEIGSNVIANEREKVFDAMSLTGIFGTVSLRFESQSPSTKKTLFSTIRPVLEIHPNIFYVDIPDPHLPHTLKHLHQEWLASLITIKQEEAKKQHHLPHCYDQTKEKACAIYIALQMNNMDHKIKKFTEAQKQGMPITDEEIDVFRHTQDALYIMQKQLAPEKNHTTRHPPAQSKSSH